VTDTSQITDNTEACRFELTVDGQLAELGYRIRGNRLVILHTGVPPELEGRGIGGALVTAALDRAVRDDLTVVPLCPFARGWLERHPDAAARVTIDWGEPDE
jgi:predicted GNAT family acetyltransferase